MLIIGCDFYPGLQQVTIFDNQSGEYQEKRLGHREEAERFYGSLSGPVRVGMEACGHYPWFERVLEKANSARWIGEQGLSCEWQKGYAVISVSPSLVETCKSLHSQPGAALSQRGRSKRSS